MKQIDSEILREKHPRFFYRKASCSYRNNGVELEFIFELENGPIFQPKLFYPNVPLDRFESLNPLFLQEWAFQIGMVELLSYWKSACSPQIIIQAGFLDQKQLEFWKNLLEKGLSEFFFVNKVNGWKEQFVTFVVESSPSHFPSAQLHISDRVLIPVGGGKDSAVTMEFAKELKLPVASLTLNINPQIKSILDTAEISENWNIQRMMDHQLLELNKEGYLNGHTPFSALLAFVSSFAGILYDFKYIALANEWSANEGNTLFLGRTINHQYSKTFDFELAFGSYLSNYLESPIKYFSWLRPLHEIQIAKIFSMYPKYLPVFLSCNRGQKSGKWCGECPKCVFVFILLSAFLPESEVTSIWGEDLFAKSDLKIILEELTGQVEVKSLECVGTRQESIYALALALQKNKNQHPSFLWQIAQKIVGNTEEVAIEAKLFLDSYQNDSQLPPPFKEILVKHLKAIHE